jgi:hypothetical protein
MGRFFVPRLLATGSLVSAASAFRLCTNQVGLLVGRTPPLVRLAVRATENRDGTGRAQSAFRDELVGLVRDSAEISWRELRRGVDDFDAFTRGDEIPAERPRRRPYRVKP